MSDASNLSLVWRAEVGPDDVSRVREIVTATRFFSAAETDIAAELVTERLHKGDASGYHFLFAETELEVVGYACFGEIGCTVGSYDIYWIAVDPTWQGGGVGRKLLAEVETRIRVRLGRHIYVETSNRTQYLPTRQFYLRNGYEIVSILPDFYQPGDDKVTLRKIVSLAP